MPLLWLSIAFLFGMMIADVLIVPWFVWAGFGLVFLLFVLFEKGIRPRLHWQAPLHHFNWQTFIILFAALFAGAARFQAQIPSFQSKDLAYYNGQPIQLIGVIESMPISEPGPGKETVLVRVQVVQAYPEGCQEPVTVSGALLVRLPDDHDWRFGDRIRLSGVLKSLNEHEQFAPRAYFSIRGVYSVMYFPAAQLLQRGTGNPYIS